MEILAGILGGVGGLSAVMGIITALKVIDPVTDELTWVFWFVLAVILLLGAIAVQSRRGTEID